MAHSKWVSPEVYPLLVAVGAGVVLSAFAVGRNLVANPDVRINKEDRAAGVLENFKEGKVYYDHWFRRWIKTMDERSLKEKSGY